MGPVWTFGGVSHGAMSATGSRPIHRPVMTRFRQVAPHSRAGRPVLVFDPSPVGDRLLRFRRRRTGGVRLSSLAGSSGMTPTASTVRSYVALVIPSRRAPAYRSNSDPAPGPSPERMPAFLGQLPSLTARALG